jgi:hypothetical protein
MSEWWNRQATVAQACMVMASGAVVVLLVVLGGGRPHGRTPAERAFLVNLNGIRGDDPEPDRIQLGKDICHLLRSGESPGAARRYFGTTDPVALAVQLSGSLSAATAPGSLCPDQFDAVERWSDKVGLHPAFAPLNRPVQKGARRANPRPPGGRYRA